MNVRIPIGVKMEKANQSHWAASGLEIMLKGYQALELTIDPKWETSQRLQLMLKPVNKASI